MMEEWQQRVIDEHAQLKDRLAKLGAFFEGPQFPKLNPIDQRDLVMQGAGMAIYEEALAGRIERFATHPPTAA